MSATRPAPTSLELAAHGCPPIAGARSRSRSGCVALAAFFVFPTHRVLGSQILITGLFALSLDLILGYAGIVSLGHAAFFGIGAYAAGVLAVHGWGEPLSGLVVAGAAGALVGFATSFLVVRGTDLARLMVTLGIGLMLFEAANQAAFITGGADGLSGVTMWKLFGLFSFDLAGQHRVSLQPRRPVRAVRVRAPHRQFAVRPLRCAACART